MNKRITGRELQQLQDALEELCQSETRYSIKNAIRIIDFKHYIDDLADTLTDKIVELIPNIANGEELTEEQTILYDNILDSQVDIQYVDIDSGEISLNDANQFSPNTINILLTVL